MSQLLNERWGEAKTALLSGLNDTRRSTMSVCLENTRRALLETAASGATTAGNVATLNRVILPVIRRVMPSVIANEIIGVQPMQGPVGQVHTLRVRYADSQNATGDGNDVTAGEEALSPFKIAQAYSGDGTAGLAANTAGLEGVPGNRLSIQILKQPVEAKSRKLSATWTFESAQDANAMHGIDMEGEIMNALATEITAEIDQEILNSLRGIASSTYSYDQSAVSGTATFVGDEHAALAVTVNRAANRIAQRTRRGPGNWAVVPTSVLTVLQSATTSAFARTTEGTFEAPTNQKMVGTLNSTMKVYVDTYQSDTGAMLIGYKGDSEADSPAFYCPYIPLMSSGVVINPENFQPTVSFMSRYGYVALTNSASSLGNAADYLESISVSNLSFQ